MSTTCCVGKTTCGLHTVTETAVAWHSKQKKTSAHHFFFSNEKQIRYYIILMITANIKATKNMQKPGTKVTHF